MNTILNHEADILSRMEVSFTPDGARELLKMDFSSRDKRRMEELLDKGNRGTRTPDEDQEAMDFERVGHVLSMLKSIARRSLKRNSS
jgi:hypothetical protein